MAKQMPTYKDRGATIGDTYGEYPASETSTEYLNKHAEEWKPPFGAQHMHLIYAKHVHWRIVSQGSAACQIPGRCHRADIVPFLTPEMRKGIAEGVKAAKEGRVTPWDEVVKELGGGHAGNCASKVKVPR